MKPPKFETDREERAWKHTRDILEGRNTSRRTAIMEFCYYCCGKDGTVINKCNGQQISMWYPDDPGCPLYPFRLGGGVGRIMTDEEKKMNTDRLRRIRGERQISVNQKK